ncbi:MAG: hypothetical protein U1F77_04365 [Kiritimatiellia bacterium]
MQHESVLILQHRAPRPQHLGSYNTGAVGVNFTGAGLKVLEQDGWIFADNGSAFVGVKFLDGALPMGSNAKWPAPRISTRPPDSSRILLHAGDLSSHPSGGEFEGAAVLAAHSTSPLTGLSMSGGRPATASRSPATIPANPGASRSPDPAASRLTCTRR